MATDARAGKTVPMTVGVVMKDGTIQNQTI
jgi:hypothetical protein